MLLQADLQQHATKVTLNALFFVERLYSDQGLENKRYGTSRQAIVKSDWR